jgi:flagellar biosynthesis GTPase FlhF
MNREYKSTGVNCPAAVCARAQAGKPSGEYHTVTRTRFMKEIVQSHPDKMNAKHGIEPDPLPKVPIECAQKRNDIFPFKDELLYCKGRRPIGFTPKSRKNAETKLREQKAENKQAAAAEQPVDAEREATQQAAAKKSAALKRDNFGTYFAAVEAKRKAAEQAAAKKTAAAEQAAAEQAAAKKTAAEQAAAEQSAAEQAAAEQSIKRRVKKRIFAEKEAERQSNGDSNPENCFNALCERMGDENITNGYFQKNRYKVDECRLVGALGKFAELKCPAALLADDFFNLLLLDVKQ